MTNAACTLVGLLCADSGKDAAAKSAHLNVIGQDYFTEAVRPALLQVFEERSDWSAIRMTLGDF